jgi:hypothetical protein
MTVSILLAAIWAVAAIGLLVFLHGLVTAPFGYQDETGFHYGTSAAKKVGRFQFRPAEWPLEDGVLVQLER